MKQTQRQKRGRNSAFSDEQILTITDIILKKFVKNHGIDYHNFEDFRQEVLEKFYTKKDTIMDAYTGKAKPETYVSAVIYRMTLGVIRNDKNFRKYQADIEPSTELQKEKVRTPEEELLIENEKHYLRLVINTLPDTNKALLFLKTYFRISITQEDLRAYCIKLQGSELSERFNRADEMTDKEIYECLCDAENSIQTKQVKPDAVRMYINKMINVLLIRLNGRNQRCYYTKDSLAYLFELVFQLNDKQNASGVQKRSVM
jgi:DNA-directed RNA polymerase specialized sigma24 family protein